MASHKENCCISFSGGVLYSFRFFFLARLFSSLLVRAAFANCLLEWPAYRRASAIVGSVNRGTEVRTGRTDDARVNRAMEAIHWLGEAMLLPSS